MKSSQTGNVMLIEETPGCLWIFGLFFIVIGSVFVYGALGGFTNRYEVPAYAIYLAFFMGSIGVATGVWIIYRAPITKIVIDRDGQSISLQRRGLFRSTQTKYGLNENIYFELMEEVDGEGDPIWSLGLHLSNSETVMISSLQSHDEKFKRSFVFEANEFIRKQMPSYQDEEADRRLD